MTKYQILKNYEHVLMITEDILGDGITDNVQLSKLVRRLSTRPEILYVEQDRIMQPQKMQ